MRSPMTRAALWPNTASSRPHPPAMSPGRSCFRLLHPETPISTPPVLQVAVQAIPSQVPKDYLCLDLGGNKGGNEPKPQHIPTWLILAKTPSFWLSTSNSGDPIRTGDLRFMSPLL